MDTRILRIRLAAALAALLMVPGTPAVVGAQNGSDIARGARVYGSMCGRCHNPRSPLERNDREWVTIANHMRVRGNLTGPQVRQVLAFLQGTNEDPGASTGERIIDDRPVSTDPGVIAQGGELVQEKACLGCHVIGDEGGNVGPNLTNVLSRRSATFVRRKLADPTFNSETSMMPNFGLTNEQIDAITAYLGSPR